MTIESDIQSLLTLSKLQADLGRFDERDLCLQAIGRIIQSHLHQQLKQEVSVYEELTGFVLAAERRSK